MQRAAGDAVGDAVAVVEREGLELENQGQKRTCSECHHYNEVAVVDFGKFAAVHRSKGAVQIFSNLVGFAFLEGTV